MAEDFKGLIALLTLSLLLTMIGLGLAAFACLGKGFWGESVSKVQVRLTNSWWLDVRLGALHGLGILVLGVVARHHPLVRLPALLWVGVFLGCLWLALPGLVYSVGDKLPRFPGPLAGGLCLAWGCALPYLGWALLMMVLLGTYGAGLGTLLAGRRPPASAPPGD